MRTDHTHQALMECAFVQAKRDEQGWFYQIVVLPVFALVDTRRFGCRATAMKYGKRDLEFKLTYFAKHGTMPPINGAQEVK